MSEYEREQSLDAEGIPEVYDAPPGRDIETDEEAFMVPRDYPVAAGDDPAYAVTAAEDRDRETVAERAAREEPDVGTAVAPEVADAEEPLAGHLMAPDAGVDSFDETPEEVGLPAEDDNSAMGPEEAAVRVTSEDVADDVDPAVEAAEYIEDR
jgi:hypothetical protein